MSADTAEDLIPEDTIAEESSTDQARRTQVRCYVCEACLEAEFPETSQQEALEAEQWDNALVIELQGGYGMFVDPLPGACPGHEKPDPERGLLAAVGVYRIVICHDCAHELCQLIPWMNRLIQPLTSHSHRVDRDWSNHEGWDLPH